MEYSFDIEEAQKYGVDEAIMLKNFKFWIMKNKANNKNLNDNRTWTFNSHKAFCELFPFWTEKQIRRILKSLIDKKVLITGNYNKIGYDRTLWYAFMDESILPNGQIERNKKDNGSVKKGEPIPDNKPVSKPNVVYENDFFKIDNEFYKVLDDQYSSIDLEAEFKKMNTWIHSNPQKKPISQYKRFVNNWLGNNLPKAPRKKIKSAPKIVKESDYDKATSLAEYKKSLGHKI